KNAHKHFQGSLVLKILAICLMPNHLHFVCTRLTKTLHAVVIDEPCGGVITGTTARAVVSCRMNIRELLCVVCCRIRFAPVCVVPQKSGTGPCRKGPSLLVPGL